MSDRDRAVGLGMCFEAAAVSSLSSIGYNLKSFDSHLKHFMASPQTIYKQSCRVCSIRLGSRASGKLLYVPPTRLSSYGDRAFSSIALRLWNSLPADLRDTHNPTLFAQRLKTHLYVLAFPS